MLRAGECSRVLRADELISIVSAAATRESHASISTLTRRLVAASEDPESMHCAERLAEHDEGAGLREELAGAPPAMKVRGLVRADEQPDVQAISHPRPHRCP